MKTLIAAIKDALQASNDLDYVRDGDIYVTEDDLLLPESVRFPAIAIKDGAIAYRAATQSQENDSLLVKIIAYVQLAKPEAAVMGDSASGQSGVLDVVADIRGVLKGNRLGGIVDSAWPESETESALLMESDGQGIQYKTLTIRYERY
jgi:hypothetical protein